MSDPNSHSDVMSLTVQLLSAYLANNSIGHEDLPDLVRSTKAALTGEMVSAAVQPESATHVPATSVRKSLASADHILSLIDGKPYKTLKRHLSAHGLSPQTYRERYNLPANYPMVAPSFAEARRAIAERSGLGRKGGASSAVAAETNEPVVQEEVSAMPAKAPRKKPEPKPKAAKVAPGEISVEAPAAAGVAKRRRRLSIKTEMVAAEPKTDRAASQRRRGAVAKKKAPSVKSKQSLGEAR